MLIDLNADLGEGAGTDADLMALISSANICCGLHAGSPETSFTTLELAGQRGVAVGAHPGYADRENFGRRELSLTPSEVWGLCTFQIGGLIGLAQAADVAVSYVKPHGALYNQACRDRELAKAVVAACALYDLPVVGLPESALEAEAHDIVPFIAEGFADRRYRPDGSLVPRNEPDAVITNVAEAVKQVAWLTQEHEVRTICVHGDNPQAVAFAKAVRGALLEGKFLIQPFT
jgi:UPF0271 protein